MNKGNQYIHPGSNMLTFIVHINELRENAGAYAVGSQGGNFQSSLLERGQRRIKNIMIDLVKVWK
jgi:hypothetical protein